VWTPGTVDVRSGARSKAFLMRLNANHPLDFMTNESVGRGEGRKASDLHHIFPRGFLKESGYKPAEINRTLNQTWITLETNRSLSDRSPRDYLAKIISDLQSSTGVSEDSATTTVRTRLQSHLIDDEQFEAMMKNDYEQFLTARAVRYQRALEATGLQFAAGTTPNDDSNEDDEQGDDDDV
jgi:hypothetical protein